MQVIMALAEPLHIKLRKLLNFLKTIGKDVIIIFYINYAKYQVISIFSLLVMGVLKVAFLDSQ